ncbi:filamentous hemagglutinin N-terminal domain-containing protein [Pseudomonas entomophila]|uniref:filamentous hemagglutinin N-terminal domain-containing protein n=1 Tax=Pseudomonas entomophila TaxID=312306 RepID=UPI0023D8231D|nr:filamentous hemagglutinin N-terminal domain-containing protein [Pseudomonas entomophila]MDF0730768.1 filamentous hemagglutinin N-terminal domain-containing protein [Pseudomonas entomophila]
MNHSPSRRDRHPALKPLSYAILCAVQGLLPLPALALDAGALPSNGQISAGAGSISQVGNVMDITQNSQQLIATWERFNIGRDAQVNFHQPNAAAVALNRVTASDASQILGQLNANGQVYLINPSGVLFGQGAAVNVGGLVASTLDIADDDFKAGRLRFAGKGDAAVINHGTLRAADGGSIALLGGQVRNEGTVVARMGSVVLGGGEAVTLDYHGDGLINMQVDQAALGASVANHGLIQADGGAVLMSARANDAMLGSVVNNAGVIEARSLQQRNGRIVLDGGDSGVVASSGTLDVSGRGAGERGGAVTLTGEYVGLFDQARIDASGSNGGGTVLLGGDYQGSGPLHQANATYVGENTRIQADALAQGDGGKVILWSRDSTRFEGAISVIGGGEHGQGGLVETSGHRLDVTGRVDLSAASGKGGTWLLDPYNINITSGANNGTSSASPFTPNAGRSSNLSSATLNASLSEGANIIVQTSSGAGTSGDINVLDNVQAQGNASLTLIAHRNVNMNGTRISNADGKTLNVSMLSNFNNSGNGSVALNNATIRTNGGDFTIGSAANPSSGYASTNVSNGSGVSISNGTRITTNGGDISIRGATSADLAPGATATAVNISGSTLDAGGGNIDIVALQASATGTGDAFILTGGSNLLTEGAGAIAISADNLGGGNGARLFSTSNTIAARGAGNVTLSGNAASGFGVLVCSTASGSTQTLSVGSGTLTVKGRSASSRGTYLAASGTGAVNLRGSDGGRIVLGGDSGASYGTVLNVTGASASINLSSDGDIRVEGNTTGGSTPALALVASGNGSANSPGSRIDIASSRGDVRLGADNSVVNTGSGSFRALFMDASGDYSNIRVATGSGNLSLEGHSISGRGVDLAPSGRGAAIDLASDSGNVLVTGTSTGSWGGYGIFLNSTGNSQGVGISTGSGDITLRGDSVGTSDAIALGGSGTASTNRISSQGGDILLDGHFHSPNAAELDHGIALLGVTNLIQTTGNGNVSLVGRATAAGDAIDFYGSGINRLSVEHGTLSLDGRAVGAHGISMLTGQTELRATGSGSINLNGYSERGNGIHFYPSSASSSVTLATQGGSLRLTGVSDGGPDANGLFLRSGSNGVTLQSAGGDIQLSGTGNNGAAGITFNGSGSGVNSLAASGAGNLTLTARSDSGPALNFVSGNNRLATEDGILLIDADSASGSHVAHGSDSTQLSTQGGAVVLRLGGQVDPSLLPRANEAPRGYQQRQVSQSSWSQVLYPDYRQTPLQPFIDALQLDLALLGDTAGDD